MSTRWASWRRDLLFALAGALVASAVLVPIGWRQVRAERQRAETIEEAFRAEHEQAEHAREAAETAEKARQAADEALQAAKYDLRAARYDLRAAQRGAKYRDWKQAGEWYEESAKPKP